jgi:hypothetical protein
MQETGKREAREGRVRCKREAIEMHKRRKREAGKREARERHKKASPRQGREKENLCFLLLSWCSYIY